MLCLLCFVSLMACPFLFFMACFIFGIAVSAHMWKDGVVLSNQYSPIMNHQIIHRRSKTSLLCFVLYGLWKLSMMLRTSSGRL